ncbi:hypothetical protein F4818DRAFT_443463 [Hypoxylon cercidicola]|nr:hypothetical protein F4818DRAFT_443463 [Hypoxylon cercidicola]
MNSFGVKRNSLKKVGTFYNVPIPAVAPKFNVGWNQLGPSLNMPKKEAAYEDYLRQKWPCSEAMPEAFDPDKLEAIRRTWTESRADNEVVIAYTKAAWAEAHKEAAEAGDDIDAEDPYIDRGKSFFYSSESNASSASVSTGVSITDSLDSDELDGYDSEVTVETASRASIVRVSSRSTPDVAPVTIRSSEPKPLEQKLTPRMGIGSRPPLSRSAFSTAGSSQKYECQRRPRSETLRNYPRAPGYFPFRPLVRR